MVRYGIKVTTDEQKKLCNEQIALRKERAELQDELSDYSLEYNEMMGMYSKTFDCILNCYVYATQEEKKREEKEREEFYNANIKPIEKKIETINKKLKVLDKKIYKAMVGENETEYLNKKKLDNAKENLPIAKEKLADALKLVEELKEEIAKYQKIIDEIGG